MSPKPDVPPARLCSIARIASSAASSRPLWPSGPSGGGVGAADSRGGFGGSAFAGMFRLPLALGGRHLLQLLLAHRFRHLLRRPLELAFGGVAALRGEGGAGGL